jgi:cell wall-associated NlpC family hydrolase
MLSFLVTVALAQNPWVDGARTQLGTFYELGGRRRSANEGIDCLGVVFAGAERATGCGWKSFSYNPTELVSKKQLGAPVEGLNPIASKSLDVSKLQPGDILMLVSADRNPKEGAIGKLDGVDVWVWHVGMYAGDGKWIVGDHFAMQAVETELVAYLSEHADTYSGVFVVRPPGVKPSPCRKKAWLTPRR